MADYSKAFSPSFGQNTFITKDIPGVTDKAAKLNLSNINFKRVEDIQFNPIAFDPNLNILEDAGWSFITAPDDISWDVSNQANRIDIFGTNNPPVVSGSRGMRDLALGNSLVEGFIRGVNVEGKIAALEKLMNYKLNQTDGFVNIPVYQITANDKVYGNGYFIIKDIKVKETMRDLRGNATRAYVDISLMEVPEYQVNTGRDQASSVASGVRSSLDRRFGGGAISGVTGARAGTLGAGQSAPAAGANSATPDKNSNNVQPLRPVPGRPIRF
jgi:hypothetical protein